LAGFSILLRIITNKRSKNIPAKSAKPPPGRATRVSKEIINGAEHNPANHFGDILGNREGQLEQKFILDNIDK
jgi:hypothetical protein